jgi:hypothetical protein
MDNELLRFARPAIATARRIAPPRLSRHAGPTHHPASPLAALLLREHPRLTYRGVEDLLRLSDRLRRLFGLRIVPDHLYGALCVKRPRSVLPRAPASRRYAPQPRLGGWAAIRGKPAIGREGSRRELVSGGPAWVRTMMQPCASAARLRGGGPILDRGPGTIGPVGSPPPRIVIGNPPGG